MRAPLAGLLVASVVAGVVAPGPAVAAPPSPVVLAVAHLYAPADLEVPQGQPLTLVNADLDRHDVMAVDWEAGSPLFQAPVTEPGGAAAVAGVESLAPGTYQFFCSVHEYMRGSVTVA